MRRIAIGDIMTRDFVSAKPSSTLHECAKKMAKERVNSLMIAQDQKLLGIITARDILWVITKKPGADLRQIPVSNVATKKIAVVKPSADISQALNKMRELGFRRLPVLSRGKLIGVVTLKDILRVEPSLYSEIREFTQIKEEARKLKETSKEWDLQGICENCGNFADLLKVEGQLLCQDCREELY